MVPANISLCIEQEHQSEEDRSLSTRCIGIWCQEQRIITQCMLSTNHFIVHVAGAINLASLHNAC